MQNAFLDFVEEFLLHGKFSFVNNMVCNRIEERKFYHGWHEPMNAAGVKLVLQYTEYLFELTRHNNLIFPFLHNIIKNSQNMLFLNVFNHLRFVVGHGELDEAFSVDVLLIKLNSLIYYNVLASSLYYILFERFQYRIFNLTLICKPNYFLDVIDSLLFVG